MAIIRCAMFDLGNVIIHFDTGRFYNFVSQHSGNCLKPWELFSGLGSGIMEDVYLGKVSDLNFFKRVKNLFQLRRVSQEDFFHIWADVISVDYRMLAVIDGLRQKGILTVLITNIGHYHIEYIRKNCPELLSKFDITLISCEEGIVKPDSEAWIRSLEALGLKAEECIFIDDHYPNIEASCGLAIKGWHYDVVDGQFCSNNRLEKERKKLKDFLVLLDNLGLLYDKTRS